MSDSPILGKPVQVIYTFWMLEESRWDTANVTAEIKIPGEFEFLDGTLQWQGELSKDSRVELIATIKAVQKGTCEITARAGFSLSPGDWLVSSATIYALILSDRGFFSDNWDDLPGEGGTVGYGTPAATSDDTVILLDLSIPHPPALGETAELTLTATAILDAPGASIRIQLPKALSLVSGNGETWFGPDIWQLKWSGDLVKDERIELKAVVKATEIGKWTIIGGASYTPTPKVDWELPAYMMLLYVFEDGADTIAIPPPEPLPKLSVGLSLSEPPALYEQAELIWQIIAINGDFPKARAQILLSSNEFKIVNGDTRWEGELRVGIPIEVKVVIEPRITGVLEIRADVDYWNEECWSSIPGAYKSFQLQVNEDSAILVPSPEIKTPTPVLPSP